jgi:hypothetical protein
LTYQPAQPLSNTQDFTNNFGWRGIGFEYRRQVKPNLALGLIFAWQVFDEQTDEVVSAFGVDISGDQFRYVNSWPMLAMQHRMDVGLYTIEETNVHFGFGPEAGVAIPVRPDLAAVLNTRLNYALAAGSVEHQSYLSFGIGVAWTHGY